MAPTSVAHGAKYCFNLLQLDFGATPGTPGTCVFNGCIANARLSPKPAGRARVRAGGAEGRES